MLQRGFLSRRHKIELTREQALFGFGIAVAYTISFYCLFSGIRELFRICASGFGWQFSSRLTLTGLESFYHNFFAAFWSCLLGFSQAIGYWTTTLKRPRIARRIVLNDSSHLLSYFNHAFAKFALLFGIFSMMFPVYRFIDFFNEMFFLFPALCIVLFLSQWTTIRRKIKGSGKLMLIGLLVTTSISASPGLLPPFDSDAVNEIMVHNSPTSYQYISLPDSKTKFRAHRRSLTTQMMYGRIKQSPSDTAIVVDDFAIQLGVVPMFVMREKDKLSEMERDQLLVQIYGDKNLTTGQIKKLLYQLRIANGRRVMFVTDSVYGDSGIRMILPAICDDLIPDWVKQDPYYAPQPWDHTVKGYQSNFPTLELLNNSVYVAGSQLNASNLNQWVTDRFRDKATVCIRTDNQSSYLSYIHLLDTIVQAWLGVASSGTKKAFGVSYDPDTEDPAIRKYVRENHPLALFFWDETELLELRKAGQIK